MLQDPNKILRKNASRLGRTMAHDCRAVANFILDYCEEIKVEVSNLTLQKLMYFCHVWVLVKHEQTLIKQSFEAWEYGPVIPFVYREFRGYKSNMIKSRFEKTNIQNGQKELVESSLDDVTLKLLGEILDFYSRLSAGYLVELSHVEDGPWHKIWFHDGKINPGMKIRDEDILAYYSKGDASLSVH